MQTDCSGQPHSGALADALIGFQIDAESLRLIDGYQGDGTPPLILQRAFNSCFHNFNKYRPACELYKHRIKTISQQMHALKMKEKSRVQPTVFKHAQKIFWKVDVLLVWH